MRLEDLHKLKGVKSVEVNYTNLIVQCVDQAFANRLAELLNKEYYAIKERDAKVIVTRKGIYQAY